jgi:hypothetical protein
MVDMEVSRKKDLILGFWGSLAGGEAQYFTGKVYQRGESFVNKFRNVMIGLRLRAAREAQEHFVLGGA